MNSTLSRTLVNWQAAAIVMFALPTGRVLDAVSFRQSSPRDKMIVNVEWLKKHINDRDVVLLQVGDKTEYDKEHLPGARFIRMQDIAAPRSDEPGKDLDLPTPEAARAKLESFGVSDRSTIVVYYGNDWVSPSTRVIFTLDWLGLGDRTVLLDGGMQAWKKEGGQVTADLPTIQPGKLSPKPTKNLVVDAEFVNTHKGKPGYALIDARSPDMYDGTKQSMKKYGHIPGAKNLPFDQVTDDSYVFRPAAALAQWFASAGVKKGDTIIGYCHLGQQATAMLFAARSLGYNIVLYDGSFHDWEQRDYPTETGK
jgi:thiosulfate/3-mercaptopyruvate sulfurtransferase